MRMRSLLKGAGLVAAAAALIVLVTLAGLLAFVFYNTSTGRDWSAPVGEVSQALTWDGTAYVFTGEDLLEDDRWAMLLDESGRVVWSLRKPADVPETYTLTDVASFTRWYLRDYPVQCRVRDDGLLVVGAPKGSVWKHDMAMDMDTLFQVPAWFAALFLLALGCVLGLAYRVLRRWFRQEQRQRDAARSNWINGVSHDIRTPLSIVLGYASELEENDVLPQEARKQAGIIRLESEKMKRLIDDLNLTTKLEYALQPVQVRNVDLAETGRLAAGEALNSGLPQQYEIAFSEARPGRSLPFSGDSSLLLRMLDNLIRNSVIHNPQGCRIILSAGEEDGYYLYTVSDDGIGLSPALLAALNQGQDISSTRNCGGKSEHGLGLKLVRQIVRAHQGKIQFSDTVPHGLTVKVFLPIKS